MLSKVVHVEERKSAFKNQFPINFESVNEFEKLNSFKLLFRQLDTAIV